MQRRRQIRYWLGSILGVLWIIQGVFGGRGSIAQAIAAGEASVHVHEPCYSPGEPIVVDFEHLPGNPNDWDRGLSERSAERLGICPDLVLYQRIASP